MLLSVNIRADFPPFSTAPLKTLGQGSVLTCTFLLLGSGKMSLFPELWAFLYSVNTLKAEIIGQGPTPPRKGKIISGPGDFNWGSLGVTTVGVESLWKPLAMFSDIFADAKFSFSHETNHVTCYETLV